MPYCTGDVHSGSNTAHYTDPDTGERYTIEHRGADNFRVVLNWLKDNFAQPGQILVAGSSAGAYGASTHYPRIRAAFPRGRALMFGDAGQGVMTQSFLGSTRRQLAPCAATGAVCAKHEVDAGDRRRRPACGTLPARPFCAIHDPARHHAIELLCADGRRERLFGLDCEHDVGAGGASARKQFSLVSGIRRDALDPAYVAFLHRTKRRRATGRMAGGGVDR